MSDGRIVTRVVGIDPSLTSTGVAVLCFSGAPTITLHGRKGKTGETLVQRGERMQLLVAQVGAAARPDKQTLVVIEAAASGIPGGSVLDRHGLWWAIVQVLINAGAPVATVISTTRAKWATGKGGADKAAVASAVSRLLPEVHIPTSDAADALVLALMGAQRLGWRDELDTKYRTEAIAAAMWPNLEET